MKSKTLAFAALLLVTVFVLTQAIAPHTALADATWTDTGGGVSSYIIHSLAYDSAHNLLYAGCYDPSTSTAKGVWKYDGTTWTNTGGAVLNYGILSLAYDSGHNLLYAGTATQEVWKYDGATWTNTGGRLLSFNIYSLAYDSGHNLLYAGTDGHGVWCYSGGPLPNFNSYIVLQNPNAQNANVTLTYMMEDGETKKEDVTVGPTSRKTLYLNDSVGAGKSFSTIVSSSIPIIAERPMYFNYQGKWTGGHDVVGALAPDTTWYFAEGYTGW